MALAHRREIDVVLATDLSCWRRSPLDSLHALPKLKAQRVSVIAMSDLAFDRSKPPGCMMTIIGSGKTFERALIRAHPLRHRRGKAPRNRFKSDWLASKVLDLTDKGRSYRRVGRELGLSRHTIADIVKRSRSSATRTSYSDACV